MLGVDALVQRAERIAPDFPRRLRTAQPVEEPYLLLRAEGGLRRFIAREVRDRDRAECQSV